MRLWDLQGNQKPSGSHPSARTRGWTAEGKLLHQPAQLQVYGLEVGGGVFETLAAEALTSWSASPRREEGREGKGGRRWEEEEKKKKTSREVRARNDPAVLESYPSLPSSAVVRCVMCVHMYYESKWCALCDRAVCLRVFPVQLNEKLWLLERCPPILPLGGSTLVGAWTRLLKTDSYNHSLIHSFRPIDRARYKP